MSKDADKDTQQIITKAMADSMGLPPERIIGIYIARSSDGDYEFAAAVDRQMFAEEGNLETVVLMLLTALENIEGETTKLFGFEATDQIVDIMEDEG